MYSSAQQTRLFRGSYDSSLIWVHIVCNILQATLEHQQMREQTTKVMIGGNRIKRSLLDSNFVGFSLFQKNI